jgi:hypothetical protein
MYGARQRRYSPAVVIRLHRPPYADVLNQATAVLDRLPCCARTVSGTPVVARGCAYRPGTKQRPHQRCAIRHEGHVFRARYREIEAHGESKRPRHEVDDASERRIVAVVRLLSVAFAGIAQSARNARAGRTIARTEKLATRASSAHRQRPLPLPTCRHRAPDPAL